MFTGMNMSWWKFLYQRGRTIGFISGMAVLIYVVQSLGTTIGLYLNLEFSDEQGVCAADSAQAAQAMAEGLHAAFPDLKVKLQAGAGELHCKDGGVILHLDYRGSLLARSQQLDYLRALAAEQDARLSRLIMRTRGDQKGGWGIPAGVFGLAVCTLFLVWQRRRKKWIQTPDRSWIRAQPLWRRVLLGPAAGVASYLLTGVLAWIIQQVAGADLSEGVSVESYGVPRSLGAIAFIVFFAPLSEEMIFRAWLVEAWRKWMPPVVVVLASAMAFAMIHPYGLLSNLAIVGAGVVFGGLWLKTRSLAICTAGHMTHNGLVVLTLVLFG